MTDGLIVVIDEIRNLLEPPGGSNVDDSCAQPFEYVADTLYAWEEASTQRNLETGASVREDFSIVFVYAADSEGEEAVLTRSRDVSVALDERRTRYLDTIRENQHGETYANIVGSSDADMIRQFEIRGIAVRVTGYRLIA